MAVVGTSTVAEIANATLLRFDNDVSLLGGDLVAEFPDSANSGAPHFHFPLPHSFPHTRMKSPCGAGWSIRDSRFFDAYQRVFVQSGPGEIVNNTFTRVGSSISIRSTVRALHFPGAL